MRFVVSKINFMDNDLTSVIKEYDNIDVAYLEEGFADEVLWPGDAPADNDAIKTEYFNCDQMINIIEI